MDLWKFIEVFFAFQQASRLKESARNWHGCRPWAWCGSSHQRRDWIWWTRRRRVLYVLFSDRHCTPEIFKTRFCEHVSMFFVVEDAARKLESKNREWGTCCQNGFAPFCSEFRSNPHQFRSFRCIQKKSLTIVMKVSYNLEPVEWSGDDVLLCEAGFDVREMISRCKGSSMSR